MRRGPHIAGVDIGGTKVAVARVSASMDVQLLRLAPSVTDSPDACFAALCDEIDAVIAAGGPVAAIGVGTASMVDFAHGRIVESTHLPLRDFPLRDELRRRFGVPVAVDNDATVACIAEHRFGAGRGADDMLMLTVGTGIGGGIVAGGRVYRGATGSAGEFGHMVVDLDGPSCSGSCPGRGCLEALVSGSVLDRRAQDLARSDPEGSVARAGEDVDGVLLTGLARNGDPVAAAVFEELGRLLGVGITNLVNIFNPELVVVGGSVSEAGELLLRPVREVLSTTGLRPQRDQVRVVAARFRSNAGVVGAAALAFTEILDRH